MHLGGYHSLAMFTVTRIGVFQHTSDYIGLFRKHDFYVLGTRTNLVARGKCISPMLAVVLQHANSARCSSLCPSLAKHVSVWQ